MPPRPFDTSFAIQTASSWRRSVSFCAVVDQIERQSGRSARLRMRLVASASPFTESLSTVTPPRIDKRVVDQILDADTAELDGSPANEYEQVLYARATVTANGYQPDLVVVSPGDALAIQLLQMTSGDSYAFSQNAPTLVVTPSVEDGLGFVADASAAGTLYSSPTRFETFVEDPRKNLYLCRYESNSEFQVHRPDAICLLGGGS